MRELFYLCECGETHQEKDMMRKSVTLANKSRTSHRICQEHGSRIIKIGTYCIDCGIKIFTDGPSGVIPKRCGKDATIIKNARQKIRSKKQGEERKLTRKMKKRQKRIKLDCKWFEEICYPFCIRPQRKCNMMLTR